MWTVAAVAAALSLGQITTPVGPPPAQPRFLDQVVGTGSPAAKGDVVVIHFLVTDTKGGTIADSQKRGLPYTFKLGEKGNDPLLELVVPGMRPGGKRSGSLLAKDVYGPAGVAKVIAPGDTLKFTITLLRKVAK